METVNWEDWLSLNIPSIDKEHKKLFGFIRELNEAIKEKKGNEILGSILERMAEYSEDHFKHEEVLFSIHNYPDEKSHKEAHQKYIEKVKEFDALFNSGETILPNQVLIFLNNWWLNHITKEDRAYSGFLIEKGVQ